MHKITIALLILGSNHLYSMQPGNQPALSAAKSIIQELKGHISSLAFLSNGHIAIASTNGNVDIIDPETQKTHVTISNLDKVRAMAAVTPNILYVASCKHNYPLFFNYLNGNSLGVGQVAAGGHTQEMSSVAVINPISMASASKDGTVIALYRPGYSNKIQLPQPVKALAAVNSDRLLAISSKANQLYIINPLDRSFESIAFPEGLNSAKSITVITPTRWAVGFKDGRILILDNATNKTQILTAGSHSIRTLAAISNLYLASGSRNGTIKIWNTENGQEATSLKSDCDTQKLYSLDMKLDPATKTVHVAGGFSNGKTLLWKFNISALGK